MTSARPWRRIAVTLTAVLALAWPASPARADGPKTPFVVARGHSLHGVPWRIRFGEEPGRPDYATFLFSIGDAAEPGRRKRALFLDPTPSFPRFPLRRHLRERPRPLPRGRPVGDERPSRDATDGEDGRRLDL